MAIRAPDGANKQCEKQVLLIGLIQFQTIKTHLWHDLFGSKNAVAESFLANSMSGVKYVRR